MDTEVEQAKGRAARKFIDDLASEVRNAGEDVKASRARLKGAFPEGHVIFAPGGTSIVALPTNLAIIEAGISKRFLIASYDRPGSLGYHLGEAFKAYGAEHGVRVEWVNGDAIIAGKESPELPEAIVQGLKDLGASTGGVSMNESIAFGVPKPPPGSDTMDIGDLLSEGRIRRRKLLAASDKERTMTHDNMGYNPGLYRLRLQELGLLRPHSFGLSYSWWGSPPNYGIVHEAKRILEEDAAAWFKEHGDSLGRHRVVMQPATPSPALGAIALGPLMAVLSLSYRASVDDHVTFGQMGDIQLLATLDDKYEHPFLDREGILVRIDRTEREGWSWVSSEMDRFQELVPRQLRGRMSAEDSHTLLTEGMNWPQDWRGALEAMTIFDDPPPEKPALPSETSMTLDFTLFSEQMDESGRERLDLLMMGTLESVRESLEVLGGEGAQERWKLAKEEVTQAGPLAPGDLFEFTLGGARDAAGQSIVLNGDLRDQRGHFCSTRCTFVPADASLTPATNEDGGREILRSTVDSQGLGDDAYLANIALVTLAEQGMVAAGRSTANLDLFDTTIQFGSPPNPGDELVVYFSEANGIDRITILKESGQSEGAVALAFERQSGA